MARQPNNSNKYPGLDRIKDQDTQDILRQVWDLARTGNDSRQPDSGLLSAIPRRLDRNDIGKLYHATDYDRLYRWNGTAWEDAPGQTPRLTVSYFPANTSPVGWARANSKPVLISTASGDRVQYVPDTIPNVNSLLAWVRL